jgi:hypothetical protein
MYDPLRILSNPSDQAIYSPASADQVCVTSMVEKCEEFYYIPCCGWSYLPTPTILVHSRPLAFGDSEVNLPICNTLLSLAAIWLVLTAGSGCSACLGSCVLGPSVTVGSSAGQAGVSHYQGGRIKSFELARYEDVVEATRRAGEALSLELRNEATEVDKTTLYYIDGKNEKVKVLIEGRTDTLTFIEIDVGLFGSKELAIVMINQIVDEIVSEGKYLQDWSHQKVL